VTRQNRPRLLVLSECLPLPAHDGGRVRFWNILRALASRVDVHLLSFAPAENPPAVSDLQALRQCCVRVDFVPISGARMRWNVVAALFSPRPLNVAAYRSPAMLAAATVAIATCDAVWVNRLRMLPYARPAKVPVALDLTDSMARFTMSLRKAGSGFARGAYAVVDGPRLFRAESTAVRAATLSFAASPVDAEYLSAASGKRVSVLPNAVSRDSVRRLRPAKRREGRAPSVLFVGSMSYLPNRMAARWLAREVWPRVLALHPTAELVVAGSGQGDWKVAAAGARLEMDRPELAPLYQVASVCAVPGRTRGGTRFKLLEAVAAGVPVVATPEGAEGLPFVGGRDLLIASEPGEFAARIVEASDPRVGSRLAESAQRVLVRELTWEKVLPPVVRRVEEMAERAIHHGGIPLRSRGPGYTALDGSFGGQAPETRR